MLKESKAMRVWEILYPVFIYYAVTLLALYVLDFFLPETTDSKLLRQLLTSFVVLPVLYSFRRQDLALLGKETHSMYTGASFGRGKEKFSQNLRLEGAQVKMLAVMFVVGGCFALAYNNLLGLVRITRYSASYTQVEQTFYTGRLALEIVALAIVIPVTEELLYRGIVYGRAKNWLGIRPAMALSSIIFGLVHMNLVQFVYAVVFGFLLAYFAEQTGNISGAAMAHMAANFTSVLRAETKVFSFMNQSMTVFIFVTAVMFLVAAAGIFYIRRQNGQVKHKFS